VQRKNLASAVSALLFLAGAGVATGALGDAAQQGFYGVIKAGAYYIDNPLTVGPDQAKKGDGAARLMPEIGYRRNSDSLELDVSYAMDAVHYADTDGLNSVQHKILGRALWKVLPEWVSLEANASRLQQAVDPLADMVRGQISTAVPTASMWTVPHLAHGCATISAAPWPRGITPSPVPVTAAPRSL